MALPSRAQFSTIRTLVTSDFNKDGLPDFLIGGNYYENNVQLGRYDGDYCSVLINQGKGLFDFTPHNGLHIKGQIRKLAPIMIGKKLNFLVGRNNEPISAIQCSSK